MKKQTLNIKGCVTQFTWDQVQKYRETREEFSLELTLSSGSVTVQGKLIQLVELSQNAFKFTFSFTHEHEKYLINVKQNVIEEKRKDTYVETRSIPAGYSFEKYEAFILQHDTQELQQANMIPA